MLLIMDKKKMYYLVKKINLNYLFYDFIYLNDFRKFLSQNLWIIHIDLFLQHVSFIL